MIPLQISLPGKYEYFLLSVSSTKTFIGDYLRHFSLHNSGISNKILRLCLIQLKLTNVKLVFKTHYYKTNKTNLKALRPLSWKQRFETSQTLCHLILLMHNFSSHRNLINACDWLHLIRAVDGHLGNPQSTAYVSPLFPTSTNTQPTQQVMHYRLPYQSIVHQNVAKIIKHNINPKFQSLLHAAIPTTLCET